MPEPLALGWNWILVVGGVCLIWLMLRYLMIIRRQRRTWVRAQATVGKVWFMDNSASGGNSGNFFKYRYTDATGEQRVGQGEPWFRKPKRKSTVWVRYDPDDPARSEVVTPLWGELTIVGIGVVSGAVLIWIGFATAG